MTLAFSTDDGSKMRTLPWAWRLVGCESSWRSNILPKDSVWDCQIWLRKPATSGLSGFIALRFIADLAGATQPLPLQSVCWSLHAAICHRAIGNKNGKTYVPLWSSQRTWSGLLAGGLPSWTKSSILSCGVPILIPSPQSPRLMVASWIL